MSGVPVRTSHAEGRSPEGLPVRSSLLLLALLVWSCDPSSPENRPDALVIFRDSPFEDPSFFAGPPGKVVGPLTVQVLGPEVQGVPGRNGRRDPVEGVEVDFRFKFKLKKKNPYLESMPFMPELLGREELEAKATATGAPTPPPPQAAPPEGSGGAGRGVAGSARPAASPRPTIPAFEPHPEYPITDFEPDEDQPLVQNATVRTDANGLARVDVRLGRFVGEYRVEAQVRTEYHQRRPVDFWLVSGLEVLTGSPVEREAPVGSPVDIALRLYQQDGKTIVDEEDRAVLFSILEPNAAASGASLEKDKDRTNSIGIAAIKFRLGDHSGPYQVLAEFEPTESSPATRGVRLEFYAMDWREVFLSTVGALALLLIGLRFLSRGLLLQLNSRLHLPTSTFARDRLTGYFGGLAVGGMFLSSSPFVARLTMFANGGLLLVAGAGAQILGAGLGKTLLVQLLAFQGITVLGFPAIAAGLLLTLLPERFGSKSWGNMVLGLGVAILGWSFVQKTAELAAASPGLRALVSSWDPAGPDHPGVSSLLTFAAVVSWSTVAAFVVRSSNLVVLFAVAFTARGVSSPSMFIAVLIGAGLGASCSVLVSSLSRSREARRVALVGILYQILGGAGLVILATIPIAGHALILHLVEWLTPGRLFHVRPENVAHHMAMLYTLFYLGAGLALFPALGRLDRLVYRILPRDPVNEAVKPYRLDQSLIDVPALALNQAVREVTYLVEVVRKTVAESFDAFRFQDLNLADQIARREQSSETVQRDVSRYLLRVAQQSLSLEVTSRVEGLQAAIGNLVRIGEEGERLRDLALVAVEEKIEIPEEILRDLTELYDLLISQFENILSLLESPDLRIQENAVKLGERLARAAARVEGNWVQRIRQGTDPGSRGTGCNESDRGRTPGPPGRRQRSRTPRWRSVARPTRTSPWSPGTSDTSRSACGSSRSEALRR